MPWNVTGRVWEGERIVLSSAYGYASHMTSPVTEVRHLRLLLAVEGAGGLRAASQRLHLTPSALSQQLRELEARLGGPLFHRTWRRLVPTSAGRRLIEAARVVVDEVERAEGEARALAVGARGTVRLASACHLSYRWLPALLRAFADAWPDVEVSLVADAGHGPEAWLRDRRVDLVLTVGRRPRTPGLRATPLFRDEVVAVVGEGHPWYGRRCVSPAAFAAEHYCGDPDFLRPDRPLGRALAAADGLPAKVTPVPATTGAGLEMARANLGVTVMARWAAEPYLSGGELHAVRVGPPAVRAEWALLTRDERPEPPLAALVEAFGRHHPRAEPRDATPRPRATAGAR